MSTRVEQNSRAPSVPLVSGVDEKPTVVVIGNGMVGQRFCDLMTEADAPLAHVVTFSEEPVPAYDRVHLSEYFAGKSGDALCLAGTDWYSERKIELYLGERAERIDRERRVVISSKGREVPYDKVVLATGSSAFVPPIAGAGRPGVFVYRTLDDLDAIAAYAKQSKTAVVIGGGLLGLEAAKAALDLGLTTHVVEFASRLMPRQLDETGARLLQDKIESLGIRVHLNTVTTRFAGEGEGGKVTGLEFTDGEALSVDLVIISAGIRPRDDIAAASGIATGPRGGILVDDTLTTNDPDIFAIGECALHRGMIYGLVGPGYQMAQVVKERLTSACTNEFSGADMSAKLKLLGVDVASFGDALNASRRTVVYQDMVRGVYKKLVLSDDDQHLIGGVLVGDADDYMRLLGVCNGGQKIEQAPEELLFGARGGAAPASGADAPDTMQVCSCNNVSKGQICAAIVDKDALTVGKVKSCTRAGSGCGGCMPLVTDILNAQLVRMGKGVKPVLCEHFAYTRQELYEVVRVRRLESWEQVLGAAGQGFGCEICKPAVASILASVFNACIVKHDTLQDTNDRYLANIQRGGLYSIVPRVPGGEITPKKLIALGRIAEKYELYTKITGGQRIDLFGARVNQLPDIWEELIAEGFESGHAYGKALRTVKSCVGSTWCRYGLHDSVGFAIRVEERYRGIRAPHKLKSAVSGCVRECAEAQSKDFGIIATDKGWNLYVCGNGGARPRHADLFASDIDEETVIKYIDRFLMFYIATADKLTRTSVWVDKMQGGIEHLKDVIIRDSLGIAAELEQQMQYLVDTYRCEWTEVVNDPVARRKFAHFANSPESDDSVQLMHERSQARPVDWGQPGDPAAENARISLPVIKTQWVKLAAADSFPKDGGRTLRYGNSQIAVFNFASRGEWYATQNKCPHMKDMVLSRGLIGDQQGVPKVACPLHKKNFSLSDGKCLSDDEYKILIFPVRVVDGWVHVELPDEQTTERLIGREQLLRVPTAAE
jgi:NAD(P)H-dependent nitrite reductase large subunit/NAD(P)H-dependent nitrite reductase small subunit